MAQETLTIGPKIGVDYTNFWGKDAPSHGGQFNYQGGLFLEYRFNDKFSIAPEVVFAAQGGKFDIEQVDDANGKSFLTPAVYHLNYINVPVMFKYYVIPSLSIDLGPQVDFNVYSKRTIGMNEKVTEDLKSGIKSVVFGVGLGLTYNITDQVFVQARYTMGLTPAYSVPNEDDDKLMNSNIQLSFGYRLAL